MITVSKPYDISNGFTSSQWFDIVAPNKKELLGFWSENKEVLEHPKLHLEEMDALKIQFKYKNFEKISNLIYRFNVELAGQRLVYEKKLFLEQCGFEAIKAIIYATDYTGSLTLDEYVGLVSKTFEEYGDSNLFDARIINAVIDPKTQTSKCMETIGLQIKLFKELLTIVIDVEE